MRFPLFLPGFCFLFLFNSVAIVTAQPVASSDPLKSLQRVKDRSVGYLLGGSGEGQYRKNAIKDIDRWVESLLDKKFLPITWDESAALIMNRRLVERASELQRLAIAFRSNGSRFKSDEKVKQRIVTGMENILEHYNPNTPRPGNWYQWLISLPNHLGATGLLMEDVVPASLLGRLKETLRNELSPELILTGTNASWEARNHIYLALLDDDLHRLERAADYVFRSVRYGPEQGIREDYCYLFHGNLPYAGGYGAGFAQTVSEFIYVFDGSPWAIKPVHHEIIRNLLLEHTRWFLAAGQIDLHVRGRTFKRGMGNWNLVLEALLVLAQTNDHGSHEVARTAAAMIRTRPDVELDLTSAGFADKLQFTEGRLPSGFRYWASGEIGVFKQPSYHVGFRQFSSRVQDYEYLMRQDGGEGGEGWNLPYGFTNILREDGTNSWYQSTEEEGGMLPEIDLDHLPGTTTRIGAAPENPPFRHDPNAPTMSTTGFSLNFGKSPFAGGVGWQDGGVAGFILEPVYGDFSAKKSLHFFPGGFWALGSDIRSTAADEKHQPVHTTVLQWASKDTEPSLKVGGKSVVLKKGQRQVLKKVRWFSLEHENVAVVFYSPTDISVRLKGKVITVWLDHGVNPAAAGYAYAVMPDVTFEEAERFAKTLPFKPVRHDGKVHAVADKHQQQTGIVFFEPATCMGMTSATPALVFRKGGNESGVFTVQDPLHGGHGLKITATGILGKITTIDDAVTVSKETGDTMVIGVSSRMGRIYRFGYGVAGEEASGVPRMDLHPSSYEDFSVTANSDPEKTVLTVHLPEDAIQKEHKLSVHFIKSQRLHDFTEADVIDRPTRNTVRYRWTRDPAVGPPVFSQYLKLSHGKFKVMLVTELIAVEDDITVPDFGAK